LVHQVVLFGLERWHTSELVRGLVALALSLLLALAMHHYVELPSARLRKRLAAERLRPPAPTPLGPAEQADTGALSPKS
jgi:peptidoglycan/LPS O-acetylase OafA/YrhL